MFSIHHERVSHLRQEPFVAGVHNDAHKKLIDRGRGEGPTGRSLVHGSSPAAKKKLFLNH
jgi:hypothetical protein